MQRDIKRGASANAGLIFHVFALDTSSTAGAGKASVAFGSWTCRMIRSGEAISGAITPEDITTIGTYAAPTANTNIRIKAVDNTNMIGVYEIQIHADWVNTTNSCQSLLIYLTASGAAPVTLMVPLGAFDRQDAVRGGMTALPNAAADAAGGLPISDAGGLDMDAILADTNELQTDWVNGGRLDLILDARASQASVDTIDGIVDAILVDTAEIGAAGAGLTAVAWNAAWDAEVQSEVADALAVYDPPTHAEVTTAFTEIKGAGFSSTDTLEAIRDRGDAAWTTAVGFSTLTQADIRTATGLASANLDTQLGGLVTLVNAVGSLVTTVVTVVDTILVDTAELQTDWTDGGRLDLILDARASQATAAAIETDTQDIQTRLPAALVGGRMDANLGAVNGSTSGVAGFDSAIRSIVRFTVAAGGTLTSIPTTGMTPAAVAVNQFKGLIVKFDKDTTTTALRGQGTDITASAVDGTLTVTTLTTAPAAGDTGTIE